MQLTNIVKSSFGFKNLFNLVQRLLSANLLILKVIFLLSKLAKRVFKILRETWFNIAYLFWGYIPHRVKGHRGLKVLVYHGVSKKDPLKFNSRFLSVKQFEQHLIAIKKCFNPISLKDFQENKLSGVKMNVMLTFDDGLKNNFENALPLLIRHRVPAVFFVTATEHPDNYLFNDIIDVFSYIGPKEITINKVKFTKKKTGIHYRYKNEQNELLANYFHAEGLIEREMILRQIFELKPKKEFRKYNDYIELMNKADLKKISETPEMSIGSHGCSHVDFSTIPDEELSLELKNSKRSISEVTKMNCNTIAFPYGNYNEKTILLCQESGYGYLFGTEKINNTQDKDFIISRMTVNPFVSAINQMYYISKNKYE